MHMRVTSDPDYRHSTLTVVQSSHQAACMAASSVLVVPLEPRKPAWPGVLPATGCSHHLGVVP